MLNVVVGESVDGVSEAVVSSRERDDGGRYDSELRGRCVVVGGGRFVCARSVIATVGMW